MKEIDTRTERWGENPPRGEISEQDRYIFIFSRFLKKFSIRIYSSAIYSIIQIVYEWLLFGRARLQFCNKSSCRVLCISSVLFGVLSQLWIIECFVFLSWIFSVKYSVYSFEFSLKFLISSITTSLTTYYLSFFRCQHDVSKRR